MANGPAGPARPTGTTTGTTSPTGATGGGQEQTPEIRAFFKALDDLSVEAPISEPEANQAIILFSVVNLMLGGMSLQRVGDRDKVDVLGILTLLYGLQDKTLTAKINVNTRTLWDQTQFELEDLRNKLEILGSDVRFLEKEAKRQFNLGLNNEVAGNVEFPRLFKRYVDIVTDPLLSMNIKREDQENQFSDKEKVGRAYALLEELKTVILQLVRSLSKFGTTATSLTNSNWADYEGRALAVLTKVGEQRQTEDVDERNVITVLADLTNKPRDTVIAPYVILARNGGNLLELAMQVYQQVRSQNQLDQQHLVDLFQAGDDSKTFFTTLMRAEGSVIKRYPLATWN
jgi:hypothetical protein